MAQKVNFPSSLSLLLSIARGYSKTEMCRTKRDKESIHKQFGFFYYTLPVVSKRKPSESALIMVAPFVESLVLLAEYYGMDEGYLVCAVVHAQGPAEGVCGRGAQGLQ